MSIGLTTSVSQIPGVGAKAAGALVALGLSNVGRLVAHLPMRHEKQAAETTISQLTGGQVVSARGEVSACRVTGRGRKPRFEVVLMDHTGRLDLVWFNQTYMSKKIHPGTRLRVQGMAKMFGYGLQLTNPMHEILKDEYDPESREARLRPVYPASEQIDSRKIETAIQKVLEPALEQIEDHLPEAYRKERELPELREAYRMMHGPEDDEEVAKAKRRLAYDELLLLQLGVHMKRAHLRRVMKSPALRWSEQIDKHIRERIPFKLTPGQETVVAELVKDLASDTPTNRLIQGDVGSGKTAVALFAMLMAAASEQQAALMAPTEILAEQHFASMSAMLQGSRVSIELLTGSTPEGERRAILERVGAGEIDILVGTHSVISESVAFKSLAVAIIDEQHRFGVGQRAKLRSKGVGEGGHRPQATGHRGERDGEGSLGVGSGGTPGLRGGESKGEGNRSESGGTGGGVTPHVIVMTATPIPRTMAITLFGDLDISTIHGMPPGRIPVSTRVVPPDQSGEVYEYMRKRLDRGEQAYVVVPAIDSDDGTGQIKDVRTVMSRLEEHELAGKRIAALHGRLKRATREHVMERFRSGLIDVLVATTVIEVGVDVPNASIMVVEHAERFGLAQLHQLRGRVGRGSARSLCVLIGEPTTPEATQRLEVLAQTSDGFVLAEKDLEIRGPGEVFGTRQSGLPPFKVADFMRDRELLAMAKRDASEWIERSPVLDGVGEEVLLRRLLKTYGDSLGLGDVG